MSETPEQVQRHFDSTVEEFDAIYTGAGKGPLGRALDRVFRRDMYERLALTLERSRPAAGRRVLDIGCGTGRMAIPLAAEGAEVTGLDFAPAMIERARALARAAKVEARCRFEVGDFMRLEPEAPFDITLAIGVFDYLDAPLPFLRRMVEVTRDRWIATFPRRYTWRAPLRQWRLARRGCPVFFFDRSGLRRLAAAAGTTLVEVRRVGELYFVVGSGGAARA